MSNESENSANSIALPARYVVSRAAAGMLDEQDRTVLAKESFLKAYEQTRHIGEACEMAGTAYSTLYDWVRADAEFKTAYDELRTRRNGWVEDKLLDAVRRGESWAVSLYLNRRHPEYTPVQKLQHGTDVRSLENLIDEAKAETPVTDVTDDENKPARQQIIDSGIVANKE